MRRKQQNFGAKYENVRDHDRKAEWINNVEKELKGLKEGSKAKHIPRFTQNNVKKKISNWKIPGNNGIHGF